MLNPTATPAQSAATPAGSNESIQPQSPAGSPQATPQGQPSGDPSEGKVTISTKEYAELQRAKARTLSFEKRKQFMARQSQSSQQGDGDPIAQEIAQAELRVKDAEQRAMRAEVGSKVRDILEKEEFKALPKSTRDLILRNPAMLSDADNVEEALLDIEDFVREQVAGLTVQNQPGQGTGKSEPTGHQTPSVVNQGAPAPTGPGNLENIDGLRGTALSRAILRNKMRQMKS